MRSTGRTPRAGLLAALVAVLVGLPALPARAAAPPDPVTGLSAALGPHGVVLTWTPSGSGTPMVRDVTGLGPAFGPGDGRAVPTTGTSSAYDTAFTNTAARSYAVWAVEEGTPSTSPTTLEVAPLAPLPTAVQLDALPSAVVYGTTLKLTGRVTRAGVPYPGARVALRSRVGGTTSVTTLLELTSAADGSVKASYVPGRSRSYQLVVRADAFSARSESGSRGVGLVPRATAVASPSIVPWKTAALIKGSVRPVLPGGTVRVQRYYGGEWHSVATRTLSSTSGWSYRTSMPIGSYRYRAVLIGTSAYQRAVSTTTLLQVVPRVMVQGNVGTDVLAMEKRLAALHYVVGRVDGYFDANTRHAVQAFQKVERLPRTGTWGATERIRVKAPRGFVPRYRDSRLTAEIDVTRQVMALVRDGRVLTLVDVSTGSETVYYQDGVKNIAHTPRGVFSIYRKIDGIRVSKLGELYRPSYFYKGWAVHGSGSVPTYPASHGCVRITNYVADLLFTRLATGTRVAVYDS